jgi:hypothetical protein
MNRFLISLFDTGTAKDSHFFKKCEPGGMLPYGSDVLFFTMVSGLPVYRLQKETIYDFNNERGEPVYR